jgi:hypothetical protein
MHLKKTEYQTESLKSQEMNVTYIKKKALDTKRKALLYSVHSCNLYFKIYTKILI